MQFQPSGQRHSQIARSESARDRQQSTGQSRAQNRSSQMSLAAWTKVQEWPAEEGQPSTLRGARRGGGLAQPWHSPILHTNMISKWVTDLNTKENHETCRKTLREIAWNPGPGRIVRPDSVSASQEREN